MKSKGWAGFVVLCVGAGSAWLYDLFLPGALTGLPRTAVHDGIVALGLLGWAAWRRKAGLAARRAWKLAAGGAFLFGVPEVLLSGASGHVSQSTETLVFMLVPVVVVFWVGQQSAAFGAGNGSMLGLLPALVGLGGAALILPFELPASLSGEVWLAGLILSAIAAAIAAVAVHRLLEEISLSRAGAILFGVSGVIAAGFSWGDWLHLPAATSSGLAFEASRLVVVDGPILLLGLWLLREMQPTEFSTRLLFVPAITLVEGILAERPDVGWYGWLGLALMAGAGSWLLTARVEAIELNTSSGEASKEL